MEIKEAEQHTQLIQCNMCNRLWAETGIANKRLVFPALNREYKINVILSFIFMRKSETVIARESPDEESRLILDV